MISDGWIPPAVVAMAISRYGQMALSTQCGSWVQSLLGLMRTFIATLVATFAFAGGALADDDATTIMAAPTVEGAANNAVADAQRRCEEAQKGPAPHPIAQKPIEKFDECIAAEANKSPLKTREVVCALGKSGGASGSTIEVYMANGRCRTDYE